ncbi:Chemotaxis response regulator protein-glutamate methylesterase CheB [Anaerovibrio sp. JC8]|uniref:chemotaxis-specific protein-glutamate methyltransferase CheB n=1 Tax=Anaerovibrio sp. JC8 TaxID=1240085 RepID=UPI000A0DFD56|nr:chemotaxis-specific protein-glutamate methyltransferase CheB [Anaerovibrio sp. JC8]ORT99841.1 Chemotaxis response regulator protein-glutamate methylesterase CheB [Anaerovibrio sp. JC8]
MSDLKILIVDDSLFFREALARGLASNISGTIEIEKAENPFEARDKILSFDPDVMILDVEMPKMNGIEFLRRLIVQYALPTVVLSSRPAYKNLALEAGAFSFIEKPSMTLGSGDFMKKVAEQVVMAKKHEEMLISESQGQDNAAEAPPAPEPKPEPVQPSVSSIQQAKPAVQPPKTDVQPTRSASDKVVTPLFQNYGSHEQVSQHLNRVVSNMKAMTEIAKQMKSDKPEPQSVPLSSLKTPVPPRKVELIAIGASTGGTEALSKILRELRPPLPPIVIVQHIPPMFSKLFSDRLNNECVVNVKEAEDGDRPAPNCVYVAPGNKQMRVNSVGGLMSLDVKPGPKYGGHCPAVNVLFKSVAENIGDRAMGVILTGMGEDGAEYMLKMREAGCVTLGQDEASSVVYGMPRVAYEKGGVMLQVPLNGMAMMITAVANYK